jgi:hypothetical protein
MMLLGHVYIKMNMFEKYKLWRYRRHYVSMLRKMDRAIRLRRDTRSKFYELKMYAADEKLECFIDRMNIKYV